MAYLFVSEVVQLGLELGLPEHLVRKAPSDGMCGMTDEDKLGFTYAELQNVATGRLNLVEQDKIKLIQDKLKGISKKYKLPVTMGTLEKCNSNEEFIKWFNNTT